MSQNGQRVPSCARGRESSAEKVGRDRGEGSDTRSAVGVVRMFVRRVGYAGGVADEEHRGGHAACSKNSGVVARTRGQDGRVEQRGDTVAQLVSVQDLLLSRPLPSPASGPRGNPVVHQLLEGVELALDNQHEFVHRLRLDDQRLPNSRDDAADGCSLVWTSSSWSC